jgi:hypothetical protein
MGSNETKMSGGGRGRVSLAVKVWKSSQKWSVQRSAVRSIAWLDLFSCEVTPCRLEIHCPLPMELCQKVDCNRPRAAMVWRTHVGVVRVARGIGIPLLNLHPG